MCDVILRFAEEGEEFHGKASGEKCILSGRAGVDHFMRFRKFSPENIFNATNAIQNNTKCTTAQTIANLMMWSSSLLTGFGLFGYFATWLRAWLDRESRSNLESWN